ncbi:poly-gamma-glutamate hydrolase family protein [Staphylococcus haemolyticus]|uniref:poly-gamma-glutamate hydrolase family protein n=1 Tax=Staphylococcus haemolyticus TaxID=1283 RepID=UPI0029026FD7|nr:poly-gamma-glutamate hydrolase family protein [Staphylococcus haemolyticus]MDU0423249.1 poly-gamma-glutamate hydrolase family protein [Staphylococcus haemolyticus]
MKMKTNIRTFSSKKLVLGIVTTVIGISTIALVSENAYASTSTVKSQIVKNTTKPTTTVKTVKPIAVKNTTTKVATNVTIKKSKATVKPIVQKAPTTTKKPSTTTKAPTTTKKPSTTTKAPTTATKKPSTTTKTPTIATKKPSATTKAPVTTAKKPSTTTKAPTITTPKPSTTTKAPTITAKKPSTTTKAPTITTPKPSTTTKTPMSTAKKPSTTTKASVTTAKKPSITTKAPTTTAKKPSMTTKAPTITTSPTTKPNASSTGNATRKQDYYKSMTELYNDTTEGIDWKKDTRNVGKSVLIVAPHGGNLEQGTSELTKLVANNGDFDYFSFEAIRPSNNTQLHVTSTNYDDATLHDMIQDRTATISIHGARGEEQLVYLGGYQSSLRDAIQSQLELKGFIVKIPPKYLGGLSNNNFINKVEESTGVQLELTTALRKAFFKNEDTSTVSRKKIENWTTTMYDFAEALNAAIKQVYPENQG